MGKLWKASGIFGTLAMSTFIALTALPKESSFHKILLILSLIFAGCFAITGVTYVIAWIKKHLQPLDILDDIRCTYWTKEKQIGVTLWICDYTDSPEFNVSCLVNFDSQVVTVKPTMLDSKYLGNTYCRGGRKRMIEFLQKNVEVKEPKKCFLTISVKPLGLWARMKKIKQVDTLIVNN